MENNLLTVESPEDVAGIQSITIIYRKGFRLSLVIISGRTSATDGFIFMAVHWQTAGGEK